VSINAYHRAQAMAERPRAVERRLLTEITREMRSASDASLCGGALMPVLHRNREVWNALSAACAGTGNQLPAPMRAGVISLALFVDRFTSQVVAGHESIDDLIDINLSIIDGLATVSPAQSAAS
jgi:flagellar protein FlaF